ncbi:Dam family site-specific DNA-(adenine-N6)-methyltransferase [Gammaproteobacteria bacterium]|nr:Dam family site-specific DNA-(adenine-N6)-methyltransferase [Gammaproteobacteria bacterium]
MVLKWAGGKNKLYKNNLQLFQLDYKNYIEPFLGGGSIFFNMSPKKALLGDVNSRLIDLFLALKDDHEKLFFSVEELIKAHSSEQYYKIRDLFNSSSGKPEHFLYLNRTCFNGVYRENMKGEFNVPIGKRNSSFFPFTIEDFAKYSKVLAGAELKTQGFEETLLKAKKGDFIFIDPPYLKNENNYESFRKYGKDIFSKEDLGRLAEVLRSLSGDCKILISNFDLANVKTLFPDWNQASIKQMSYISGAGKGRKPMEEVLIYNY